MVGKQILTYEDFLNGSDFNCLILSYSQWILILKLTPEHFLTIEPLSKVPVSNYTGIAINKVSRWQLLERLHQDFWTLELLGQSAELYFGKDQIARLDKALNGVQKR